jgi:hypothetical protein
MAGFAFGSPKITLGDDVIVMRGERLNSIFGSAPLVIVSLSNQRI